MSISGIFSGLFKGIISFADDAYDEGYLWYLLGGLILIFAIIMIWNRGALL